MQDLSHGTNIYFMSAKNRREPDNSGAKLITKIEESKQFRKQEIKLYESIILKGLHIIQYKLHLLNIPLNSHCNMMNFGAAYKLLNRGEK